MNIPDNFLTETGKKAEACICREPYVGVNNTVGKKVNKPAVRIFKK